MKTKLLALIMGVATVVVWIRAEAESCAPGPTSVRLVGAAAELSDYVAEGQEACVVYRDGQLAIAACGETAVFERAWVAQ